MGDWYTVGVGLGLGVAFGILLAGLAGRPGRALAAGVALLAAAAGVGAGLLIEDWTEALAGAIGGLVGAFAAVQVVGGALRRGGTRGGVAALVAVAAVVVAALALVPVAGYLAAVAAPALAVRLRARASERYAGLRTLAK